MLAKVGNMESYYSAENAADSMVIGRSRQNLQFLLMKQGMR